MLWTLPKSVRPDLTSELETDHLRLGTLSRAQAIFQELVAPCLDNFLMGGNRDVYPRESQTLRSS